MKGRTSVIVPIVTGGCALLRTADSLARQSVAPLELWLASAAAGPLPLTASVSIRLGAMLVAMVSVHVKNGFFAMGNGIELPFLYAVAAVGVAFSGAGIFSLDASLGLTFLREPYLVEGILVLAAIGAAVTLASRRQVPAHDTAPAPQS